MNIYESAEDYLERILILQEKQEGVRSIDIAHDMGFSKPSVSVAMKKLKEAGLIIIDDEGFISLTKEGREKCARNYAIMNDYWETVLSEMGNENLKDLLRISEELVNRMDAVYQEKKATLKL